MYIVGQNRIYTPCMTIYLVISLPKIPFIYAPYMTIYLVISLPKMPYMHRIYMVLANPTYVLHTVYDRVFGDVPAKVPYTHRIYVIVMANPMCIWYF
jgi:hypothetical protein